MPNKSAQNNSAKVRILRSYDVLYSCSLFVIYNIMQKVGFSICPNKFKLFKSLGTIFRKV